MLSCHVVESTLALTQLSELSGAPFKQNVEKQERACYCNPVTLDQIRSNAVLTCCFHFTAVQRNTTCSFAAFYHEIIEMFVEP